MNTEEVLKAIFWTLLISMFLLRFWFAFRVWQTGERIRADRAALQREGWGARAIAYMFFLLLGALVLHVWLQGGTLRTFAFPAPDWLRWAGVGLGLTSVGLFAWTHTILGRLWSPYLQLRPHHQLITIGPYARIRHPMYSAIVGWMMSLGLVSANWIPLVFAALFALNFRLRIQGEEEMMLQQFGDEYREYMKRTGRLLPGSVWRRSRHPMNEDVSHAIDRIAVRARRLLIFSASYVVACIPAILLAEALHWPQWPFHSSQFLMCVVCAASATTFWFRTRGNPATPLRRFAFAAMLLSGVWLAFIGFVIILGALVAYEEMMP
jgi:protein-S-isoprenylcysteine O-methyltransferase Ste14